jgi:IclR family KDG regulon transcriptional repressor
MRKADAITPVFTLLQEIARHQGGCDAASLRAATGASKSSLYRMIAALQDMGMVRHDPDTGRYSLGLGLWSILAPALAELDARKISYPVLQDLHRKTGGSTFFVILLRDQAVLSARVLPREGVVVNELAITTTHFHANTVGKLLLAYKSPAMVETVELPRITEHTITDRATLRCEIEEIKKQGFALNRGETDPTWWSVAAPVRDFRGEVMGALALMLPVDRRTELFDHIQDVIDAASTVSRQLGYVESDLAANADHARVFSSATDQP